jgi:putative ABC transport system permease protein
MDAAWGGPSSNILSGRVFDPNKSEVILDSRLIPLEKNFTVGIGSNITLDLNPLPSPLQVKITNLSVVGIYDQDDSGAPDFVPRTYYAYTSIETAWRLLNESTEPDFQNHTGYSAVFLRFAVSDNQETEQYIQKIETISESGDLGGIYVEVFSLAQFQESIEDTLDIFGTFTTVISMITAIAGGMAIVVSQLMSVTSRMKEFAILKATGWKNRHIFQNIIFESLTMSTMGAVIGMALGGSFIGFLSSGASPFGPLSAIVTPGLVIQILSFAFVIGIIGGLYPGIKASRVRPVVVLKGE